MFHGMSALKHLLWRQLFPSYGSPGPDIKLGGQDVHEKIEVFTGGHAMLVGRKHNLLHYEVGVTQDDDCTHTQTG